MAIGQFGGLVADIPGAVQRGLQFQQAAQLRPGQLQQQQLGTQRAEQQLVTGGLQQQQIQQGIETEEQRAKSQNLFNTVARLRILPDAQKASFIQQNIADIESRNGDSTESRQALVLAQQGKFEELNTSLDNLFQAGVSTGFLKTEPKAPGFTLGNQRFDASGKVIATGVAPKPKLSSLQQKVAAEGLDPNTPAGQARAREITQGTRTDPSLKPSEQQVLNKATEGQLTSSVFANRVKESNEIINNLENIKGFEPASITSAILQLFPGGNIALSDEQQQYVQAKRDIITAVLRKQSGAVIGESEFENEDKKLFPQVGDSAVVKEQKRKARNREFESLKAQSKGVFGAQFGQKTETDSKPPASIARPTPTPTGPGAPAQPTVDFSGQSNDQLLDF
jgi:hypothetical protein